MTTDTIETIVILTVVAVITLGPIALGLWITIRTGKRMKEIKKKFFNLAEKQ